MEFNKPYNRTEFVTFLRSKFLPEDFEQEEETVHLGSTNYATSALKLGTCESLKLVVYEVKHNSHNDARVGLSRDAFRMLANEYESRALVVFVPEDSNDNYRFSFIELTLSLKDDSSRLTRTYSNPHRYSYYLGTNIAYHTPNKYLNELGRVNDINDLKKRFSVKVLTNDFYEKLSDWYAWALTVVSFPNNISLEDDTRYNHEGTIRLITRLIFVWFLKQRHLIPDEFFDPEYVSSKLLNNFTLDTERTLFAEAGESQYYKAILQNLFFGMLNSPITNDAKTEFERKFSKGKQSHGDYKVMRHEDLFKDSQLFLQLANNYVPFLNGGLFDCLDDDHVKDDIDVKGEFYDGFSDNPKVHNRLFVPDYLFFREENIVDLSWFYGNKKKNKVKVSGIINILKLFNFTVEENTPFDQDVSLDPELLGQVFENLLAAFNPETQTTARKQTGSFYTPREIVQYMVDESLIAHLCRTVDSTLEPYFRKLVQYTDDDLDFTLDQRKAIMKSLYNCKVLDPACGSGAFPVGMLQQMVHILNRIDPDNEMWKEMMLQNAISETSEAYRKANNNERAEIIADIERSFDENVNRPDYARKLYLIENCIYGVDIQPIAIQISKLRFFISLIVDQNIDYSNPRNNFGIRPLPNLEAKFVAANSLIPLQKNGFSLFNLDEIKDKEVLLKDAQHRIFRAKTYPTKKKYKSKLIALRKEIADTLLEHGCISEETSKELSKWDMFNQNNSAPFFDTEWMFDITDGFDIVIGNPPYGIFNKKQNKGESIVVPDNVLSFYKQSDIYKPAQGGMLNIFRLFVVKSTLLLRKGGVFSEIFPLAFACDLSSSKLRKYIFDNFTISSFEAFPERDDPHKRVFENAKISVCILNLIDKKSINQQFKIRINHDRFVDADIPGSNYTLSQIKSIDSENLTIPLTEPCDSRILVKVFDKSQPLSTVGKCYTGELDMTFCKEAFTTEDSELRMLRGANINRYVIKNEMSQGVPLFVNKDKLNSIKSIPDTLFNCERIIMQGITGVNEKIRLKMTICQNTYCANSVNYILLKDNINPKYALALLNSKLMNYIFKLSSTNSNVNGYEVDNLPFIIADDQAPYIELVEHILEQFPDAEMAEEKIDNLVYHLYGLTYDEVKIVDPQTSITKESYDV
jgi:Alw26I/Eco31I/Esp3I family type II restriction m6 adenine DNA methyltransferase